MGRRILSPDKLLINPMIYVLYRSRNKHPALVLWEKDMEDSLSRNYRIKMNPFLNAEDVNQGQSDCCSDTNKKRYS